MYAIIETGGKQYKVRKGDTVDVELLDGEIGDQIELDHVLMVSGGGELTVGTPTVEDALVRATVVGEVRGDKVVVFKYKPKNRYSRKTGHRQNYTRLEIDDIVAPGWEDSTEEEAVEEAPAAKAASAEPTETAEESVEAAANDVTAEPAEETEEPEATVEETDTDEEEDETEE